MPRTKNMNKNFSKNPIDFILLIVVLIMLAMGIIMVMSASAPTSLAESGNSSYEYVKTQALSAVLGLILMLFISKIDYKLYKNFYKLIYIAVLILLASVAVIGKEVGRSKTLDRLRFYEFPTI